MGSGREKLFDEGFQAQKPQRDDLPPEIAEAPRAELVEVPPGVRVADVAPELVKPAEQEEAEAEPTETELPEALGLEVPQGAPCVLAASWLDEASGVWRHRVETREFPVHEQAAALEQWTRLLKKQRQA